MNSELVPSPLHLRPPLLIPIHNPSSIPRNLQIWKRRRVKLPRRRARPPLLMSFSFEGLIHNIISVFPSVNSLDLIVPALSFTSGAALYLFSNRQRRWEYRDADGVGEWIMFSSPTPFNQSVLLRCPSLSFEDGGELLDGVNERLVEQERHSVRLNRGRIPVHREDDWRAEDSVSYQRICVGTDDGGVIALDWPENLDLEKEHGLDTTVMLVPGTTEGSLDRDVKAFVCEALKYGYFPIVMNPRGCAGSPLTTPRLFTAADSDDICTAIQFIKRSRPWTTVMSVGWGYGANMLTKYLSEVGEQTPLTAAVCINNPFDLEEATKSYPHRDAIDRKLAGGLVDILQTNKEIFQGKRKGFNVTRALSATSVRDFEGAISMISYGFETVEEFYLKSSSQKLVSSVKIPLLFIQGDDGTVPLFSVPRSLIAENPFTSLLMCSYLPSNIAVSKRFAIIWCQHLALEWLQAVELALLKGRHPLPEDVDIPLNSSSGLALIGNRASEKSLSSGGKVSRKYIPARHRDENGKHFLKLHQFNDVSRRLTDPVNYILEESNTDEHEKESRREIVQAEEVNAIAEFQNRTSENVLDKDDGSSADSENSQVLATATVVLNMLDVTNPGSLDDEQKKKILTAVEQGETLMKAMPEDVRGRLTNAISKIVQTKSTNFNLNRLMKLGWNPNVKLDSKPKIQEGIKGASPVESDGTQDQRKFVDSEMPDGHPNLHPDSNTGEGLTTKGKTAENSEFTEASPEMEGKSSEPNATEKISITKEAVHEQAKVVQSHTVAHIHEDDHVIPEEANDNEINKQKKGDTQTGENTAALSSESDNVSSSSCPEHQQLEKMGDAHQKETQNSQDKVDQNLDSSSMKSENSSSPLSSFNPPPINVSEALDTFKSFDDSTQMAVNSVFGVIENMIDQLEKKTDQNDKENSKRPDQEAAFTSNGSSLNGHVSEKIENDKCELSLGSDSMKSSDQIESNSEGHAISPQDVEARGGEEKLTSDSSPSVKNSSYKLPENNVSLYYPFMDYSSRDGLCNYQLQLIANAYWESSYKAYLKRYFSSQIANKQSFNSQATTDLFLDPEKGQWKMSDQISDIKYSIEKITEHQHSDGKGQNLQSLLPEAEKENAFQPSHVILDNERSKFDKQSTEEPETAVDNGKEDEFVNIVKEKLVCVVKGTILNALKIEVNRRLGMSNSNDIEPNLASELEEVAGTVSQALLRDGHLTLSLEDGGPSSRKFGTIQGQMIIHAISSAVQNANHLRKVLPIGVIVGSSLASLRKSFDITDVSDGTQDEDTLDVDIQERLNDLESGIKNGHFSAGKKDNPTDSNKLGTNEELGKVDSRNGNVMVGAFTAVLGASTLLAYRQKDKIRESYERIKSGDPENDKVGEAVQDNDQSNLVSSFAEKAMSVAGPIVPTKSDGELDEERLLSIFAELGQKGGILRFFGNVALLWGGMRGALSLTDRLIRFLHIADRPLFQRILGFICMVLVIWTPVAIPLLPKIVQSWTTNSSSGTAGYACLTGLRVAILILIMLWGRRIRGYESPLKQYGLSLSSNSKVCDFLWGLIGGTMLVMCVHSINALLGYASFVRPPALPPSSVGATMLFKAYCKMILLSFRGITTATCVAIVEELLFRSWLPGEIAVDLGYHLAIILSGLTFALLQRSLSSIPGFLFLSLALFGVKQRDHGSLYIPIGIRTGVMVASFMIQTVGFVTYMPGTPFWLASTHPWHPFDGAVGLSFCVLLVIFLYPRRSLQEKNNAGGIHEQKGES